MIPIKSWVHFACYTVTQNARTKSTHSTFRREKDLVEPPSEETLPDRPEAFEVLSFGRKLVMGRVFQNPRCRCLAGLAKWKRFAFAQSDLISAALGTVYS